MEIIRWVFGGKSEKGEKIDKEDFPLLNFPPEVTLAILEKCDIPTQIALKVVCREWFLILDHYSFWKRVLENVIFFSFPDDGGEVDEYKVYAQRIREEIFEDEIGKSVYQYAKQQQLMEKLYSEADGKGVNYLMGDLDRHFEDIDLQRIMDQIHLLSKPSKMFKCSHFEQYYGDLWKTKRKIGPGNRTRDYVDYIQDRDFDEGENTLWSKTNGEREFFSIRVFIKELDYCPTIVTLFQRYSANEMLCFGTECREIGIKTGIVSFFYHAQQLQAFKALLIFGRGKFKCKGKTFTFVNAIK